MSAVFGAVEVHHAVDAGKGGAATLVGMRVQLLLGEDVSTVLFKGRAGQLHGIPGGEGPMEGGERMARGELHTSQEKETMMMAAGVGESE